MSIARASVFVSERRRPCVTDSSRTSALQPTCTQVPSAKRSLSSVQKAAPHEACMSVDSAKALQRTENFFMTSPKDIRENGERTVRRGDELRRTRGVRAAG